MDNLDRSSSLFEAELLTVRVVAAFVTVRHRNAWHSTTSKIYRGSGSLAMTRSQAEDVAEGWRQRGSWFLIHEVPVLLLGTSEGPIAIAEFHTKNSFAKWQGPVDRVLAVGSTVDGAIESLGRFGCHEDAWDPDWRSPNPSTASFIIGAPGWGDYRSVAPRKFFRSWSSDALFGRRERLRWSDVNGSRAQRARAASEIVARFHEVNGPALVTDGEARYEQAYEKEDWSRCFTSHHLLTTGMDWEPFRADALRFANRAEVTAEGFRNATELFLGKLFLIRARQGDVYCAPIRDDPEAFDEAVEAVDSVLETLSKREERLIRAECLLWAAPEQIPGEIHELTAEAWSQLRSPFLSRQLRDVLADPDAAG